MNRKLLAVLCAVLVFAAAGPVSAEILTFSLAGQINEGEPIPDSEGDLKIGDDTILDITYRDVDDFGIANDVDCLRFQIPNYGDLETGVAYAGQFPGSSVGEIRFQGMTVGGQQYEAQLFSFDLAGFDGDDQHEIDIKVYDEDWNVLAYWDNQTISGTTRTSFAFDPVVSSSALVLQWSDPWDVAIDNVVYDAVAVPEPATVIGWVIGLGCLGYVTYRRRGR
ncbi:MAG: hypothetical protein GXY58_07750 [Planctomycetaceae bacterium]|nr:hypothetical protein [Planctomycetaceae bacterium]